MTTTDVDLPDEWLTAAGFLHARRNWLKVSAVGNDRGGWDIVLRIDGTYFGPDGTGGTATKQELVDYFTGWLDAVLANQQRDT